MRCSLRYQTRPSVVLGLEDGVVWNDLDRDLVMAYWSLFPEYDPTFAAGLIAWSNLWAAGKKVKVEDMLPKVSKPLTAEETHNAIKAMLGG